MENSKNKFHILLCKTKSITLIQSIEEDLIAYTSITRKDDDEFETKILFPVNDFDRAMELFEWLALKYQDVINKELTLKLHESDMLGSKTKRPEEVERNRIELNTEINSINIRPPNSKKQSPNYPISNSLTSDVSGLDIYIDKTEAILNMLNTYKRSRIGLPPGCGKTLTLNTIYNMFESIYII